MMRCAHYSSLSVTLMTGLLIQSMPKHQRAPGDPAPPGPGGRWRPGVFPVSQVNTCGRCSATWTAMGAAHCPTCHRTYSDAEAFDGHRDGKGRCCLARLSLSASGGAPGVTYPGSAR